MYTRTLATLLLLWLTLASSTTVLWTDNIPGEPIVISTGPSAPTPKPVPLRVQRIHLKPLVLAPSVAPLHRSSSTSLLSYSAPAPRVAPLRRSSSASSSLLSYSAPVPRVVPLRRRPSTSSSLLSYSAPFQDVPLSPIHVDHWSPSSSAGRALLSAFDGYLRFLDELSTHFDDFESEADVLESIRWNLEEARFEAKDHLSPPNEEWIASNVKQIKAMIREIRLRIKSSGVPRISLYLWVYRANSARESIVKGLKERKI